MKASLAVGARHFVHAVHDVVRHPTHQTPSPAASLPGWDHADTRRAVPGDFQSRPQPQAAGTASLAELRDRATHLRQAYAHKDSPFHLPSSSEMHDIGKLLGRMAGDHRLVPGDARPLLAAVEERAAAVAELSYAAPKGHGSARTQRQAVGQMADAMDTLAAFLRGRTLQVLWAELDCGRLPTAGQWQELRDVVASVANSAQVTELLKSLQQEQIGGLQAGVMQNSSRAAQAKRERLQTLVDSARALVS